MPVKVDPAFELYWPRLKGLMPSKAELAHATEEDLDRVLKRVAHASWMAGQNEIMKGAQAAINRIRTGSFGQTTP